MFGEPHHFGDVDRSGSDEDAATYLTMMAEMFGSAREDDLGLLELGPGAMFLDAGCGLGEIVIAVSERVLPGGYAVGIDLSAGLISKARDAASARDAVGARFEIGDVRDLRYEDGTFDAVRCERVLQHLADDAARAAVAEFVRVTKRGGRIQLIDPVHSQHIVECDDFPVFEAVVRRLMGLVQDPYSGIRLAHRLRDAGATIVSFDAVARCIPSLSVWRQALGIDQHLDALVSDGHFPEARARAFLNDLADRENSGDFYAVTIGYRATALRES